MASQWITIAPGFEGWLSLPPSGRGPGIVMVQEIFGVNRSIRETAELFAARGYVVLAPDVFWRQQPRVELGFDEASVKRAQEFHKAFDYGRGVQDLGDAVKALRARPECAGPVAVLGFCLGGTFAYLAAARLPVDGGIAYYGTRIHQYLDEAAGVRCPLLLHFGSADHNTPPEVVEKVRGALGGKPGVQIHVYEGANHAFANHLRTAYHASHAALAHERSFEFLRGLAAR
jgi:carboxymethylenebutenolidase